MNEKRSQDFLSICWFASEEGFRIWTEKVKEMQRALTAQKRQLYASEKRFSVGSRLFSYYDPVKKECCIANSEGKSQVYSNIQEFCSGERNDVILFTNGRVQVMGDNNYGQKNTLEWRKIAHIAVLPNCVYGITGEGLPLAAGSADPEVMKWKDLQTLKAEKSLIAGLHRNGSVSISGLLPAGVSGEKIKDWNHVINVEISGNCLVALNEEGRVYYCGKADDPRAEAEKWTEIIALAADSSYVYGLKKDGHLVMAGKCNTFLDHGRQGAAEWQNLTALSANQAGVGALTESGELLFAGTMAGDVGKAQEAWKRDIGEKAAIV